MNKPRAKMGQYVYRTTTDDHSNCEFFLELYDYSPDLACNNEPIKVITNFDELLTFITDDYDENFSN
ncbi:hypothetical protein H1Z61_15575 [Bacillus aquiflavi]|uniref:Uncharacterized protein n=1 Tax=Bacillus aquiflavi TaxID=2672567 RepID=A0A6B3W618_9BACI|nr:hypothetical protein [Bacillus aquiflavi]MBA4538511.1 hypothetical protein [Bacillus aquiflavi]NEY82874.1 hypothetical protein [Bacillus aquiflavi]UAC49567.1 hypothetical protein K6959_07050 [Bacillus aquiflavi]